MEGKRFTEVVVDSPARLPDKSFHYSIPSELEGKVTLGSLVNVPFGRQRLKGFVIGFPEKAAFPELKEILSVADEIPFFDEEMLGLARWVAKYYCSTLKEVLHCILPPKVLPRHKKVLIPKVSSHSLPSLTREQGDALNLIKEVIDKGLPEVIFLKGITGSGKTEVYLQAISYLLGKRRQAIVLLPKVSLTPQTEVRFRERFGGRLVILHSQLSRGERYEQWRKVQRGEVDLVIGTRLAVFAPFPRLGLIILDEEQETSYKQKKNPRYHAREVARCRAKLSRAVVILGSATPTLESYFKVRSSSYRLAELKQRIDLGPGPEIEVVDLRKEERGKGTFSKKLTREIRESLKKKERILLFLNQRGYSPFIQCFSCGFIFHCPHCQVSLTYYQAKKMVRCHYCNYQERAPHLCPQCQSLSLNLRGIGTQKVEEEIRRLFPLSRFLRMDKDTTWRKGEYENILTAFAKGEADILLGTQMVAKRLDFPGVALVGVINADTALNLADFRASERTFQLLVQLAGRCGRGNVPGKVIIQTYNPEHHSIKSAQNLSFLQFYEQEIAYRKELNYPPFSHLINIVIRSNTESRVKEVAHELKRAFGDKEAENVQLLGPSPCPLSRIRDKYRWHLMLRGKSMDNLLSILNFGLTRLPKCDYNYVTVDVDPLEML